MTCKCASHRLHRIGGQVGFQQAVVAVAPVVASGVLLRPAWLPNGCCCRDPRYPLARPAAPLPHLPHLPYRSQPCGGPRAVNLASRSSPLRVAPRCAGRLHFHQTEQEREMARISIQVVTARLSAGFWAALAASGRAGHREVCSTQQGVFGPRPVLYGWSTVITSTLSSVSGRRVP